MQMSGRHGLSVSYLAQSWNTTPDVNAEAVDRSDLLGREHSHRHQVSFAGHWSTALSITFCWAPALAGLFDNRCQAVTYSTGVTPGSILDAKGSKRLGIAQGCSCCEWKKWNITHLLLPLVVEIWPKSGLGRNFRLKPLTMGIKIKDNMSFGSLLAQELASECRQARPYKRRWRFVVK